MATNPQRARDTRTGRFLPAGNDTVTVRQRDGSARTYRIARDRRTGDLVQHLRDNLTTDDDTDDDPAGDTA